MVHEAIELQKGGERGVVGGVRAYIYIYIYISIHIYTRFADAPYGASSAEQIKFAAVHPTDH